ncbi:GIY-YIG nuclease family protein [Sulfitobacter sp. R18_1]|uniref:GIY-YIG nuclease family protein n=1 Tax=Sulfitobacter sp. R18_1 TaxID=2821104 RepID=UPI001ADCF7B4|nr:GIY-YIG nuclease family protein [Sulfitobacter sp. R18_1]MBO9427953.1 GIY-YIG nuclease family protein [Sulfitobacter sp. R18_1]
MSDDRPAYVYMLATCDKGRSKSYVGWTYDPEARLKAHNTGRGAKSTKGRDWRIIHLETHPGKSEAMSAEWYLKKDKYRRQKLIAAARKKA